MSTHAPLTKGDAILLGELLTAMDKELHVRWSPEDTDLIYEGTLRHGPVVSPENFCFFNRADEDVRDGYVRISSAFETAMPVMEAVRLARLTLLVWE